MRIRPSHEAAEVGGTEGLLRLLEEWKDRSGSWREKAPFRLTMA